MNSKQSCQLIASTRTAILTGTCRDDGANIAFSQKTIPLTTTLTTGATTTAMVISAYTLNAPLFQIVYQASDTGMVDSATTTSLSRLAIGSSIASTPSSIQSTHSSTSSTSSSTISSLGIQSSTTSTATQISTTLSPGVAAGIAVGGTAAVLIIALLAILYWRAKRRGKTNGRAELASNHTAGANGFSGPSLASPVGASPFGYNGKTKLIKDGYESELAASGEHDYYELGADRAQWTRAVELNPQSPIELSSYSQRRE